MREPVAHRPASGALREVAVLFLKLGTISFGGPAAHVALMRQEAVQRRRWLTDQQFLDLLGGANLIPGPTSTELAIFLGYRQAGWPGLLLAGLLFILPAVAIVLALAWAYTRFGASPGATALLYGIKPVIIAVIAQALWGLGRTAIKRVWLAGIGVGVMALYFLNLSPIILLFGGGAVGLLIENSGRLGNAARRLGGRLALVPAGATGWLAEHRAGARASGLAEAVAFLGSSSAAPVTLWSLFLAFLKVGAVVYGSGYVLLAFLRADLIDRLAWLTDRQLIDAIAVGQFTPGPVFTTATFIGYLVAGLPGALVATLGIFLPSFIFVALAYPLLPHLRGSVWARGFLDGANVAALGLMAAVTVQLGLAALVDPLAVLLALASLAILIRWRPNSAWLVLGGAAIGGLATVLGLHG